MKSDWHLVYKRFETFFVAVREVIFGAVCDRVCAGLNMVKQDNLHVVPAQTNAESAG